MQVRYNLSSYRYGSKTSYTDLFPTFKIVTYVRYHFEQDRNVEQDRNGSISGEGCT
jgi:hypothetical protein